MTGEGEDQRRQRGCESYERSEDLPKVLSDEMRDLARKIAAGELTQAGTGIDRDELLKQVLASLGESAPLPRQAYGLVAEIVSFLYHCDRELASK